MLNVGVFCAAGMSTSILVAKIRESAKKRDVVLNIKAYSESDMKKITNLDCALLGPQIRYLYDDAKGIFTKCNTKVNVINSIDYGTMNGDAVLDMILDTVNNKELDNGKEKV